MSERIVRVHFRIDESAWQRAMEVIEAQGWREDEGLRILIGYGAAALVSGDDDAVHALGALRGELASLRHRAYMVDEAVRNLEMNLTGLNAGITQGERSLAWSKRQLAELETKAAALDLNTDGVDGTGEPSSHERLMTFLGKSRERPGS